MTQPLIEVRYGEDTTKDFRLWFEDTKSAPGMIEEIFADNYKIFSSKLEIRPRDVIIDAGANEGMFSVLMSTNFPEAKIYALEPVTRTFNTLVHNLELNGCKNVTPMKLGLGKPTAVHAELSISKDYSGGSTAWCTFNPEHHFQEVVDVMGLDQFFALEGVSRCRLLKMDIEGMEYEVLYNSTVLPRVDYIAMEVHHNRRLDFESVRADGLVNWISGKTKVVHVDFCNMAE